MANLMELLSKQADKVEKPPILPPGPYMVSITSHKMVKSTQKGTDGVEMILKVMSAHESVDMDALDKVKNWKGKEITATIWLTENSMWRLTGAYDEDGVLKQEGFFQQVGIDTAGKTVLECLAELDGKVVMAELIQKPNKDNTSQYNEVKSYQKVS